MSMRFRTMLTGATAVLATAALALPADAEQRRRGGGGERQVTTDATTSGSGGNGSVTLSGTADADATNGGEVNTNVRGRTTDRRGVITSVARARDEDERSRSRSRTIVTPRGDVRTREMDFYRQRGERPVITRSRTNTRRDD